MASSTKPRIVKISTQMQVRIPRDLFERYGFGSEAVVVATKTGVEFRPMKSAGAKCADLLESLVGEGLSGDELVARFRSEVDSAAESVEYHLVEI